MSKFFDVDIFILGHQPQPNGWSRPEENLIIFTCDHSHGCLMEIDLTKSYTTDELVHTNDTNVELNKKLKAHMLSLEAEVQKRT